ncbi:VIR protein [Plasmodium vivax]|uniref:VIR protein n=1 Tax=Plasmodium vivax TaxID=5855 RepID=A0A1G4EBR2_PLAVI|nr:VIR protein [Plasmodium vivax]
MNDFLGKKKLGNLRTKYYYDKFDNGWNTCKGNTLYNSSKQELTQRKELHDVSEKILKALCYVYETSMRPGFDNDVCNFLYYWLANILLNNLKLDHFYSEIIIKLFANLKNDSDSKICNIRTFTTFNKDEFNKVKLIFDFSEDFDTYKSHFSQHNHDCNKNYKEYLDTYITSYNKIRSECITESRDYIYCSAFHHYFNNKNHGLLSTWKCNLSENDPRDLDLEEGVEEEEVETDGETVKVLEQLPPNSRRGTHGVQSDNGFASVEASRAGYLRPEAPDLYTGASLMGRPSSPTDNPSPSITSKSITGAVSVAGILVPSYLMYNYTYAGTWINKVLGRKTRTNFNPYTDQFLMANISGPENFYSERSRYNISYRPE